MSTRFSSSKILTCLVASLLFACAFYQLPLFSVNQHTYFLHGLAQAGYGHLAGDWLSHQTDHVPVFSWLVTQVYRMGSPWLFQALFGLLASLYAASLLLIASSAAGPSAAPQSWQYRLQFVILLLALLTALHSTWMLAPLRDIHAGAADPVALIHRLASVASYGVAGQTLLGHYLQPSSFGVLLLASIACFLLRRDYIAIVCALVAASLHPTFVLHAGILTVAYMLVLAREGRPRQAFALGLLALLLVLPIVLYVMAKMQPDSPASLARANAILANERIPHHTQISVWLSRGTWLKLAIVLAGILAARHNRRLFLVLSFCAAISIALSLLQWISGSNGFALLFPWRLSTWLVPACTAILLGEGVRRLLGALQALPDRLAAPVTTGTLMLALGLVGLVSALGLNRTITGPEQMKPDLLAQHAAHQGEAGQTYLVPLGYSSFRLTAGLPVFIDWKSHPFRDVELVEWHERVQLAQDFYAADTSADAARALAAIQAHAPVTHIVVKSGDEQRLDLVDAEVLFRDADRVLVKLDGG
ncbi:MAG: DUF6798 domain-containing protein [Pseudomonadota bacterium]